MANLLIVDSQGRRRVQLELEAASRGHKVYCAGSTGEAVRLIPIYVPQAIIAPDRQIDDVAQWLRQSEDAKLKRIALVSQMDPSHRDGLRTERAKNGSAAGLLDAAEAVIGHLEE